MRDYIIMTDSCCSLNQREVDELGITVLPLSFTMEGKTYLCLLYTSGNSRGTARGQRRYRTPRRT